MPLSPTANMSLIEPTPGSDSGTWGDLLNTLINLIDAHDHTTGKGIQIVPSAMNINADLSFGTNSATHLKSTDFDEIAAFSSGARRLFWNSSDHELYVRTAAGVNVKVTNGAALNVAAFTGGIGGDYAAAGALLSYDDATKRYLLQQEGSPRPWAGLATGDIDLYEKLASIVNAVKLKSPSGLAAGYTVTFPAAIPIGGSAVLVQVSTASPGQLIFSDTLTDPIIGPDFRYSTAQARTIPAAMAELQSNARSIGAQGTNAITLSGGTASTFPLPLLANETITGYSLQIIKNSNASSTVHARLYTTDSANAETAQGAGSSNNGNADGAHSLQESSLTVAVPALGSAYIAVWVTGGGTTDAALNCTVTSKRA
jgi:hypothetical protein